MKPAELINFAKVRCELPGRSVEGQRERYVSKGDKIPIVEYEITLSNNGYNFSMYHLPVVLYDSRCKACLNTTHCTLKVNDYFILHPLQFITVQTNCLTVPTLNVTNSIFHILK